MSNPEEREPELNMRVKRQTALPAHLQDYDLNLRLSPLTAACVTDEKQDNCQGQHSLPSPCQEVQLHHKAEKPWQQNRDLMQKHNFLLPAHYPHLITLVEPVRLGVPGGPGFCPRTEALVHCTTMLFQLHMGSSRRIVMLNGFGRWMSYHGATQRPVQDHIRTSRQSTG